tara:strand:- start:3028 stop:3156 length:129 start_codon:yes stop_codon:yes gene_type:complete
MIPLIIGSGHQMLREPKSTAPEVIAELGKKLQVCMKFYHVHK